MPNANATLSEKIVDAYLTGRDDGILDAIESAYSDVNLDSKASFKTVALLLADTTVLGYSGARFNVSAGDIVTAGGFRYEVAASGASDHHLVTAGGVKLINAPRPWDFASIHTQQLMERLERGENCNLIVAGDSTGDASTEWVYLLAEKLAADYPNYTVRYQLWDSTDYASATTIQTGAGTPPTLDVWNASIASTIAVRFGAELATAFNPSSMGQDADLIMLSYGHNGGSNIERHVTMTAAIAGEISRYLPFVPIIIVGQNPVTDASTMAEKVRVLRSMAGAHGWGWLDIHSVFKALPSTLTDYYLSADNVHPNALGSEMWAKAAHAAFRVNRNAPATAGRSPLRRGVILHQNTYAALGQWTAAQCALSKESSIFESAGESLKIVGSGAGSASYIYKTVISSNDIASYRGRYVTVTFRIYVSSSSATTVGRPALYDGTTTILSTGRGQQVTGWSTQSITLKVGTGATSLIAYLYLSDSGASSDTVYVDRVTVSDGPYPADSAVTVDAGLTYEEGDWTPTYTMSGTDFDSVTYDAVTAGRYVKIGKQVTVTGNIQTDAITIGSASGVVSIGGLPFVVGTGNKYYAPVNLAFAGGFAGDVPIAGRAITGASRIALYYRTSVNGSDNNLDASDMGTGANANYMSFSCTYITA